MSRTPRRRISNGVPQESRPAARAGRSLALAWLLAALAAATAGCGGRQAPAPAPRAENVAAETAPEAPPAVAQAEERQEPAQPGDDLTSEQREQLRQADELSAQAAKLPNSGQFQKAVELFQQALKLREAVYEEKRYPQGHPKLAESVSDLGELLRAIGAPAQAAPYLERALAMRERLYPEREFPKGHQLLAESLMNMGVVLRDLGEYSKAQPLYARSLAMYERVLPDDDPDRATALNNMGMWYQTVGDYGTALPYYERALEMRQRLRERDQSPERTEQLASSLNSLGALLKARGEYDRGIALYKQALELREGLYRGDHPRLVSSLNNLAGPLRDLERYKEATAYQERALAMCRRLFPQERFPQGHELLAANLTNMGKLLQVQGDYDGAFPLFRQARDMYEGLIPRERLAQGDINLAASIANLGELHFLRGEYDQALDFYERALAMRRQLFPQDKHPHGHPHLAASYYSIASVHHARGELARALPFYEQSATMFGQLTEAFLATASEAEALNYLVRLPTPRDAYLSVAAELPATAEASYAQVWRGKAVLTRLLERRQQARVLAGAKAQDLAQRLQDTRVNLSAATLDPNLPPGEQARRIKDLTDRKEKLERELAAALPAFEELQARDRRTPRDLLEQLPDKAVFIDFLRVNRLTYDAKAAGKKGMKRQACYLAYVLRKGQPIQRVDLKAAEPIDKALDQWGKDIQGGSRDKPERESKAAHELSRLVWAPLLEHVPPDTTDVFVAPDGPLTRLPWAALPGRQKGHILLDEYAVALVPHGRLLLEQLLARPDADRQRGLLLAVGGVWYDNEPPPRRADHDAQLAKRQAERGGKLWGYLYDSETEVNQVAALAGTRQVLKRQGIEATTKQLLADLPRARWAHLATHGFFNDTADPDSPWIVKADPALFDRRPSRHSDLSERVGYGARNPLVLSGVVLARANEKEPDGGILTAEAIAGLPLQKLDLAVLSACQTGLGETAGGEGVFGLQRAFHVAGTRTVVASLWKVDDEATAALMTRFYQDLWQSRLSPRQALREAQLTLYRNPQLISKLARSRAPDLDKVPSELSKPPEKAAPGDRTAAKYWACFTISGLGD
jgi:CHAT domain-containing protein